MTAIITLHDITQGSDEWLEARLGKYTGSNSYKLLTSMGATEYAKAIESSFTGNFHTDRGHLLEDETIGIYEAIHKTTVLRPGFITNSDLPTCLYSPDGLDDEWLLEVKCFSQVHHMKLINGDIDMKIKAQIHFGMMISGKKKAKLIAYHPKLDLGSKEDNIKNAYKEIPFKANPLIFRNFKRILTQ